MSTVQGWVQLHCAIISQGQAHSFWLHIFNYNYRGSRANHNYLAINFYFQHAVTHNRDLINLMVKYIW